MWKTLSLWLLLGSAPALASADTLGVLYFADGGDASVAPLKVGLAQMLITDIHDTPGLQVVERARLQEVLDELELGHAGVADAGTAAQLGKVLGARWLLLGTTMQFMGTLQINAHLVDVETAAILDSVEVHGPSASFFELEDQLALRVQAMVAPRLGAAPPSSSDHASPTASAPDPAHTARAAAPAAPRDPLGATAHFSAGLIALDRKDAPRAREAFEAALLADAGLEDAQAALAALSL
ncbi:MAG: hypothetical protein JXX28_00735 [Deltaproteobacteria bacterium]|nr:hypothetical protein [Deltaproteobacteria bacterium]